MVTCDRTFRCIQANYPHVIMKEPARRKQNTPQCGYFAFQNFELVLYGIIRRSNSSKQSSSSRWASLLLGLDKQVEIHLKSLLDQDLIKSKIETEKEKESYLDFYHVILNIHNEYFDIRKNITNKVRHNRCLEISKPGLYLYIFFLLCYLK